MAVNAPQSQTQAQTPRQPQQAQVSNGPLPAFGLTTKLSTFGSGGDTYEKLYAAIQAKVKYLNEEVKSEEKYSAIKMLKQNAGLNYSAIVVSETLSGITAAHVLMVEKTGDYPDKLTENIAGVRYEIVRTPADALDDRYILQAQQTVAETLKVDMSSVVVVDGTLVPNEFDVTSESLVNDLINNTFNAVHAEIGSRVRDYTGYNLSSLISNNRGGKFFVNLYFNSDDSNFFDQTGMPIRQDVCISLSYKQANNQNNKSINQGNDSIDIVKTYGYIDFEWTGPTLTGNMMTTQKFIPNFIITHIDSQVAPTPDILMMGVASVLALNEDMNWMQAFRPTPIKKNEIDYNDIGALNIEGNIENNPVGFGKKYDTKAKTYTISELNKLIQTLVRPNMMISIDIPKAGPETWYTSVLHYIKFRNSKEAFSRVNSYIATMTNGAFQAGNTAMFNDTTNKIHGGYYKTKDGVRDIRHLGSYLSVANHINDTNQQPVLISQYTNTLYNSSIPSELRAAERKKFIDNMSNNSAVYKQYYDRVTFSSSFLLNLIGSMKSIGFSPVFSNLGAVNDMFVRRSTSDFSNAVLAADARIIGQNNVFGGFYAGNNYTRTFA